MTLSATSVCDRMPQPIRDEGRVREPAGFHHGHSRSITRAETVGSLVRLGDEDAHQSQESTAQKVQRCGGHRGLRNRAWFIQHSREAARRCCAPRAAYQPATCRRRVWTTAMERSGATAASCESVVGPGAFVRCNDVTPDRNARARRCTACRARSGPRCGCLHELCRRSPNHRRVWRE